MSKTLNKICKHTCHILSDLESKPSLHYEISKAKFDKVTLSDEKSLWFSTERGTCYFYKVCQSGVGFSSPNTSITHPNRPSQRKARTWAFDRQGLAKICHCLFSSQYFISSRPSSDFCQTEVMNPIYESL